MDSGQVDNRTPVVDGGPAAEPRPRAWPRLIDRLALRAEDLLLAGWIVLIVPLLAGAGSGGSSAGPFDAGHPLDGLFRLAGFFGALACLATRGPSRSDRTNAGVLASASVGPLVGGLLLVGGSAFAALGQDGGVVFLPTFVAVIVLALAQSRLPVVSTSVRRALVTPYLLAAGGIFWGVVHSVTGGIDFTRLGAPGAGVSSGTAGVVGLLMLGSAVYYAMLIYAPRQIAEREGGPLEWIARFGLFVVSVGLGMGWLSLLGG